jgi:uncharacterized protein DUF6445
MLQSIEERAEVLRTQVADLKGSVGLPAPSAVVGADVLRAFDNVLKDPDTYRHKALQAPVHTVTIVNPVVFQGLAECDDPELPEWLVARFPFATPGITYFRRQPEGQVEPNFIHTDRDMGDWTGVLYLNPHPPMGDGTTFWEHRLTHARASTADTLDVLHEEWMTWRSLDHWQPWYTVAAKFNRLVLFPAPLFHSRAVHGNYGQGAQARLTQVIFGTGSLS